MKLLILNDLSKLVIVLFFLFGLSFQLKAQEEPDEAPPHFVFPAFIEGTIVTKSGKRNQSLLNYHKITQEMIFEYNGKRMALYQLETIDTVIIQDRKFIPEGKVFYEIALDAATPLYIQHRIKVSEAGKPAGYGGTTHTGATDSYSLFFSSAAAYELELPKKFKITEATILWVRKNDELLNFRTKKQFLKIFWEYEDELKSFIKKNKIDMKDREDLIKLVAYCNEEGY